MENLKKKSIVHILIYTVLIILISTGRLYGAQQESKLSFEQLELQADSLWIEKSFIQLQSTISKMMELSNANANTEQKITTLLHLHEYEAYYTLDNDKSLEYILEAVLLADRDIYSLSRLKVRSRLIYFHQNTTQNETLVLGTLNEMKSINAVIQSTFYDFVIRQWQAHFIGLSRAFNQTVSELDVDKSISTLKETLLYFSKDNKDQIYYYQQARRIVIGFFSDKFGFDKSQEYIKELDEISWRMKSPLTKISNLIFEGGCYRQFGKHELIISRYNDQVHLLENGNQGLTRVYYGMLAEAYTQTGDFKSALAANEQKYFYGIQVNAMAFENKMEVIKSENAALELKLKNQSLKNQNLYFIIASGIFLAGLLCIFFLFNRLRIKNKIITEQKNSLREIDASKNKLFAILAHDLRAPINSFNNISQKIKFLASKKDWDRIDDMFSQIAQNTSNLDSALRNILPWMSTHIRNPKLTKTKTVLKDLIDLSMDEMSITAQYKEIIMINQCNHTHVAHVDVESMRIVLRNLLSNAIKYSNEGGEISVQSINKKNSVELRIVDEGVGMSQELKHRIFMDYVSADGTSGEKGYGLGLVLAKDLVISNGGAIDVISEKSKGTTVVINLQRDGQLHNRS